MSDLPYDWMPMQARLIRANGTDLDVVNAARRSFGQQSTWGSVDGDRMVLKDADKRLRERLGLGAQEEARVIARMLYNLAVDNFPVSVPALVRL